MATKAVIQFGAMKVNQIVAERKGKPIPNWWRIDDVQGFGLRISEGDLNFMMAAQAFPIPEEGEGHFLFKLVSTFTSSPVGAQGYEFMPMPQGTILEQSFPIYAEGEQELMDGMMQAIADEAENILCQILQ